ncbi:hypothetical protein MJO28_010066 [Puccinia striiformis f. sp. tritici]|uniref:Uncharacterized protein n=1 Tax=Puccinia striiformis f. sp. tritici TaxID=168172 RepID=A0ACC0E9A5_9BASI|nr:hypothetical protein MJO28_010066 [Puccinia striiformis f. sp. tritici]
MDSATTQLHCIPGSLHAYLYCNPDTNLDGQSKRTELMTRKQSMKSFETVYPNSLILNDNQFVQQLDSIHKNFWGSV